VLIRAHAEVLDHLLILAAFGAYERCELIDRHWAYVCAGVRKLAYRVQKYQEGLYILLQFSSPAELVKEVERRLRNADMVIKFITVRVDERLKKVEKRKKARAKRAARKPQPVAAPAAPAPSEPGPTLGLPGMPAEPVEAKPEPVAHE